MSKSTKQKYISKSSPQLILIFKESAVPMLSKINNLESFETSGKKNLLAAFMRDNNVSIDPVFKGHASKTKTFNESIGAKGYNEKLLYMDRFYSVAPGQQMDVEKLRTELLKSELIEAAFYKPQSVPPLFYQGKNHAGGLKEEGADKLITGDLTTHQTYLDPAPGGVDAKFAWTIPGGMGDGITIIDVEGGWNFLHEDLQSNSRGLLSGFNHQADNDWFQHGTAVLGVIGGDTNTKGVSGICPNASIGAVSVFENSPDKWDTAKAIYFAADQLNPGDILLIEQERGGPNFINDEWGTGYIALEWWPDDFLAILYATSKGIIVVEAAGNGFQDLDDAVYDTGQPDFPDWWRNPFRRKDGMDSGAILVGAGAPPPGTNGIDFGPDRSRLDFSNFGSCIDVQGWGEGVTTTGFGDIHGDDKENNKEWYTDFFNGTSSASPIITGVVACLQGIQLAARRPLLTPNQVRELLRTTGSAQQSGGVNPISERIGNRPDLRQLIESL